MALVARNRQVAHGEALEACEGWLFWAFFALSLDLALREKTRKGEDVSAFGFGFKGKRPFFSATQGPQDPLKTSLRTVANRKR